MTSAAHSSDPGPRQGRVRWRRFAAMIVPALVGVGVMVVLTAQGALGVSFAISGKPFTITATQLKGTGFEQYGGIDVDASGTAHPVFVSSFSSATLSHLCQSVTTTTPLGAITLRITAGGSTPASASNLVVDANALTGNATFTNINIGQDPTTFTRPAPSTDLGTFGQSADAVTINNLRQNTLATTAGTFTLPGLGLGFGSGC